MKAASAAGALTSGVCAGAAGAGAGAACVVAAGIGDTPLFEMLGVAGAPRGSAADSLATSAARRLSFSE